MKRPIRGRAAAALVAVAALTLTACGGNGNGGSGAPGDASGKDSGATTTSDNGAPTRNPQDSGPGGSGSSGNAAGFVPSGVRFQVFNAYLGDDGKPSQVSAWQGYEQDAGATPFRVFDYGTLSEPFDPGMVKIGPRIVLDFHAGVAPDSDASISAINLNPDPGVTMIVIIGFDGRKSEYDNPDQLARVPAGQGLLSVAGDGLSADIPGVEADPAWAYSVGGTCLGYEDASYNPVRPGDGSGRDFPVDPGQYTLGFYNIHDEASFADGQCTGTPAFTTNATIEAGGRYVVVLYGTTLDDIHAAFIPLVMK
jgi:hypothetical protein